MRQLLCYSAEIVSSSRRPRTADASPPPPPPGPVTSRPRQAGRPPCSRRFETRHTNPRNSRVVNLFTHLAAKEGRLKGPAVYTQQYKTQHSINIQLIEASKSNTMHIAYDIERIKLSNAPIRPLVRPSVCLSVPCSLLSNGAF